MTEDQEEPKELGETVGEALKEAEEEEQKESRDEEQEEGEEQSALTPEETTSYVEQPADVSEGVESDSELEDSIDASEEGKVESVLQAAMEKDEKHINSHQAEERVGGGKLEGAIGKKATIATADMDLHLSQLVKFVGTCLGELREDGESFEDGMTNQELNIVLDVTPKVESDLESQVPVVGTRN